MKFNQNWHKAVSESGMSLNQLKWSAAEVPGAVGCDHEESEIWYRNEIPKDLKINGGTIEFSGLTAPSEIYLDDSLALVAENSFTKHSIYVSAGHNTQYIYLRFLNIAQWLSIKRPRPRWKSRLINHQSLRWLRAHFFGRMPGFAPPEIPKGIIGQVDYFANNDPVLRIEVHSIKYELSTVSLTESDVDLKMTFKLSADNLSNITSIEVELTNSLKSHFVTLKIEDLVDNQTANASATIKIKNASLWFPHTHGEPNLYNLTFKIKDKFDKFTNIFYLSPIGFRSVEVKDFQNFGITINGVDIFCRGATWTPIDPVTFKGNTDRILSLLMLVKKAGLNMLRISGTMGYENREFYDLCDKFGILVWQDFAFANLDYPFDNSIFLKNVTLEAQQFLIRTSHNSCIVVCCGGSEIQQQASMLGLQKEYLQSDFFDNLLPKLCNELRTSTIYLPSTPTGGPMPFHSDEGVTHYYGVGAYLRPFNDARTSGVKFASECLAFSNVPENTHIEKHITESLAPFNDPTWKARIPRDMGVGWNFEDVREHYFKVLFGIEPSEVRYQDPDRYLRMSRVVTGEVMMKTFCEWRRNQSKCNGALVWYLKDLWPSAGWGIIDSDGNPKSPYFYLSRVLQPVSLFITDEGLNGISIHLCNDTSSAVTCSITLKTWRDFDTELVSKSMTINVNPRQKFCIKGDAFFGQFYDLSYSYKFGPSAFSLVSATAVIEEDQNCQTLQACYFPTGFTILPKNNLNLRAQASMFSEDLWEIKLQTSLFCQAIALEIKDFELSDNYFHLLAGSEKSVIAKSKTPGKSLVGHAFPLNAANPTRIVLG